MMKYTFLLLISTYSTLLCADAIAMRDYITLRTGMSEAEVLYKFGPSDHETIRSDRLDFVLSKTWFYIPIRSIGIIREGRAFNLFYLGRNIII